MPHKARKQNSIRLCPVSMGVTTPHSALNESRTVQTEIQNRSTDPKNSGARTNTTIVVQNWIELNVATRNSDCGRGIIAMKS